MRWYGLMCVVALCTLAERARAATVQVDMQPCILVPETPVSVCVCVYRSMAVLAERDSCSNGEWGLE